MLDLIREIESFLPPHWIWLVRAVSDNDPVIDFGEYFANIVSPDALLRFQGHAHTPTQALQNAFDSFIEHERKIGRIQ